MSPPPTLTQNHPLQSSVGAAAPPRPSGLGLSSRDAISFWIRAVLPASLHSFPAANAASAFPSRIAEPFVRVCRLDLAAPLLGKDNFAPYCIHRPHAGSSAAAKQVRVQDLPSLDLLPARGSCAIVVVEGRKHEAIKTQSEVCAGWYFNTLPTNASLLNAPFNGSSFWCTCLGAKAITVVSLRQLAHGGPSSTLLPAVSWCACRLVPPRNA